MRIALLSPVWFSVPPQRYGGTERVVALLADGLVAAGHDVTLFASGDSYTRAHLEFVFQTAPTEWIGHTYWELQHAIRCIRHARDFDILNDHTGMLGLALSGLASVPCAHTVHGPLVSRPGEVYAEVMPVTPRARLISLSMNQRRPQPDLPWIANCPNALDLSMYPYRPTRGDYLLFLGRMSPDKGAHRAVTIALETGLPLMIAAKCNEPEEHAYFEQFVRPHLTSSIEYVGEVAHAEKVELLQHARALIFPIDWEEPFGLVVIEAMACGTPVIATRRGAVPEIIEDGRTGILVDHYREMPSQLERADRLDPDELRRDVETRFSPQRMVSDYISAYEATIESVKAMQA